ncbi:pyruvate carboxyltransferase [Thiothrix nivea]|uniref:Pyruvate carboxyltransferase n=1 Tax=Thiothrix nivea (strain ATCC 35100 / DSM 5205 / JP2) TaxID=870187 RepID=A0A656HL19_THINJ|nr:pyruvate carboxyltransferase [Thiothrix nivea]EIJ36814.1 pyruvate carboxyltransferase [Thiothrix nivea DSM 5205]
MADISLENILDVTLRDGGYLNQWQFSRKEVRYLLDFLARQGIRQVEVGFLRTAAQTTSVVNGCPATFLQEITQQHPGMQWVGMLNPADADWREAVAGKLPYLSLVRLTCTAEVIGQALEIAAYLHEQSPTIKVSINLICISSYRYAEIVDLLKRIAPSPHVDRLYFADSRGALLPHEIEPLYALAKQHCQLPLGFHAHDTLGNAVENSNRAFVCGCDLIDVSLNSFGLAGGNTSLAAYLKANALADTPIETATLDFCEQHLSLREADMGDRGLFALLARQNVDPIWSDDLLETYPHELAGLIDRLPRQPYKTLDEVLTAIRALEKEPCHEKC